jgi:hypothetical protein
MTRKRAKSEAQTSFGTPGTTETSGAPAQPAYGFPGILPTAIVYAVPEFTWGMSVQSTSADCQILLRRGSQARSLSEERPKRARF